MLFPPPPRIHPARPMTSKLTPTEVAYIMLALMQSVALALWLVSGWVMRDTQWAATHWSAFAGLRPERGACVNCEEQA